MKQQEKITVSWKQSTETQSLKLKDYTNYFSIEQYADIKSLSSQLLQLLPSDISYDKQSEFASNLIVKVTKCTNNHEIIDVQARLGYFIFHRISIIKVKRQSQTHQTETDLRGSFCNVYRCQCNGIPLAVKCFLKLEEQTQSNDVNILGSVIEEYCILKLASCFKVGPKVYDNFECAIVVYPECIEICMELCSPLPKISELTKKRIQRDLKENLGKLHSLSIIHYDIKTENICFSNVFDKYVFIDFGMGKIVKETIGFKSVSGYRGTFNYCSDQMAQLFFLDPKSEMKIDLFFNDLVALKKTIKNFQFQTQICGNLFFQQSNSQLEQSFSIREITKTYRFLCIKYNIYQQQYNNISKGIAQLEPQQIKELFSFIKIIQASLVSHKEKKQLVLILKEYPQFSELPSNNYCFQFYQEKGNTQIIEQLNKINKKSPLAYFFNFFHQNFNQLILVLKDSSKIANIELLDFCCLLSKAIQVNASTLSLQQLEQICQIGYSKLMELKTEQPNEPKGQNIVLEVSRLLFIKAFENHLVGKYFQVFCSIINSIFFFELLSEQQTIIYYKQLLSIKLPFKKKLTSLVKFNSALVWQHMGTASQASYLSLRTKMGQINKVFCFQSLDHFSKPQAELLKMVLINKCSDQHVLEYCKKLSKEIYLQVSIYLIFWEIYYYSSKLFPVNRLRQLDYQLSFLSDTIFQYYHFSLIMDNIEKQKPNNILLVCSNIFLKKQSAPLSIIIKSIMNFRRQKNFKTLVEQLYFLKDYQHQRINRMVQIELLRGYNFYKYQFQRCSIKVKEKYFNLCLKCSLASRYYFPIDSLQFRCQNLIQRLHWEKIIKKLSLEQTGQILTINLVKQPSDHYLALQSQLRQQIKNYNFRSNTTLLMKWNVFVITFLNVKGKAKQSLKLAKYILRLTKFIQLDFINSQSILKAILSLIIVQFNFENYQQVKQENRDLYFEYADMILKRQKEEMLIANSKTFSDILSLMYKFKIQGLFPLISKILDKLRVHSNQYYTQKIIKAFSFFCYHNKHKEDFMEINNYLQTQMQNLDNPYKIIFINLITKFRSKNCPISKKDFLQIFSLLDYVNAYVKQYILKKIYLSFLCSHWDTITKRRRFRLNKKVVQYDWLTLSATQMFKLFIALKSRKALNLSHNRDKLSRITNALNKYRKYTCSAQFPFSSKIRVKYGEILIK